MVFGIVICFNTSFDKDCSKQIFIVGAGVLDRPLKKQMENHLHKKWAQYAPIEMPSFV